MGKNTDEQIVRHEKEIIFAAWHLFDLKCVFTNLLYMEVDYGTGAHTDTNLVLNTLKSQYLVVLKFTGTYNLVAASCIQHNTS